MNRKKRNDIYIREKNKLRLGGLMSNNLTLSNYYPYRLKLRILKVWISLLLKEDINYSTLKIKSYTDHLDNILEDKTTYIIK